MTPLLHSTDSLHCLSRAWLIRLKQGYELPGVEPDRPSEVQKFDHVKASLACLDIRNERLWPVHLLRDHDLRKAGGSPPLS